MKTLLDILQKGTEFLASKGCDEARSTMQYLLGHVLRCNRTALYSQFDRPMQESELVELRQLMKRRIAGDPLQHLLGTSEFFRREFRTDARALIPRPETEELTEMILADSLPDRPLRILDMGTGSGIIGITLALELKERVKSTVLADISPQALDLALENALRLGAKVATVQTDLFEQLPDPIKASTAEELDEEQKEAPSEGHADAPETHSVDPDLFRFDIIAANLPYIADGEPLAPEVLRDPHTALFGGPLGWEIIDRFLCRARDFLREDGLVALEIGYDQADIVTDLMKKYGYSHITVKKDLNGIARFPFARR